MEQQIKLFPYFKVTPTQEGLIFSTTIQIGEHYHPVVKTFPNMRMLPYNIIDCTPKFFIHVENYKKQLSINPI